MIAHTHTYVVEGFRVCVKSSEDADEYTSILERQTGTFFFDEEEALEVVKYLNELSRYEAYQVVEGIFSLPPNTSPEQIAQKMVRVDWTQEE